MHPTRVVKVKNLGAVLKIRRAHRRAPVVSDWQRTFEDPFGPEFLESRDGVEWWEAPCPRRWHRCRAQTWGLMAGAWVQRCACGAIDLNGVGHWMGRNGRKRK